MKTKGNTQLDFAREIDFSRILTNPILDISARLWEDDRYEAFKVCYRSMRRIDDLVDHRKEREEKITPEEAALFKRELAGWLDAVRAGDKTDEFRKEFLAVTERFAIPLWPWERLCEAMIYDIEHDGFPTILSFVRYTEGAAIAPASIFMHLCGLSVEGSEYRPPKYDIRLAARPLALFSYFVHIMRDFQKDQLSNLNYFADSVLTNHNLDRSELESAAGSGLIPPALRDLMATYKVIAEYYRQKARRIVDRTLPMLAPRYQLSLEMIYSLYLQIFERIDPANGDFSTAELNPSPQEVAERIRITIQSFSPVTI